MQKGQQTREFIVSKAARLFNLEGYNRSSISSVMRETGLQKGGIYRHFSTKEELALESFEYAVNVMKQRYLSAIEGKRSCLDQLVSLFSVYNNIVEDPPLEGGCPLLNTAVDSDDTQPVLKQRAQAAMDGWYDLIRSIIHSGIQKGEFKKDIDPEPMITFLTSAFEGGVMISKLYDNSEYMRQTVKHLTEFMRKALLV